MLIYAGSFFSNFPPIMIRSRCIFYTDFPTFHTKKTKQKCLIKKNKDSHLGENFCDFKRYQNWYFISKNVQK